MALFNRGDFPEEFDFPQGQTSMLNPAHGVQLTLQDLSVVTVLSTLEGARQCRKAMNCL